MNRRIHALWPTWSLFIGSLVLFVGERVYSAAETTRMVWAVIGAAFVAAAVVMRINEFLSADADKKPVASKLMYASLGIVFALIDYAMITLLFDGDSEYHLRWRGTLWGVWPTIYIVSAFTLVAIEAAVAPVAFNPRYEHSRIKNASTRGLSLGLLLGVLFFANYLADAKNEKIELSAENTTTPSEQTRQGIRDLTKKVRIVLFYPRSNEVSDKLLRYFEPLAAMNENIELERVDHALGGELAKEADVTDNGFVALLCDGAKDKIRVGTKPRSARSALRRFDTNFLKSFVKVTTQKKIAYIVTGHDERATKTADKEDKRSPIKLLKRQLEAWQFTVKNLGVTEGLGSELPKDDGVIFVFGPEKDFLDAEIDTLLRATDSGVRMFIALEAERDGTTLDGLLNPLGINFDKTRLANERVYARLTRTEADVSYIVSNKYSSHESVTTMTRNARDLPTLLFKAGSLAQVEKGKLERVKTELVLKAMDDTFRDANDNLRFDKDEKKDRYGLAAAITRTSTSGKKGDESRIYVLADTDVVGDKLIKTAQANLYLFRDAVAWLQRSNEPVVPTVSEKDVKLVHKKEDDALIFYGTTFVVPGLVMLLGYFGTRRRRRS